MKKIQDGTSFNVLMVEDSPTDVMLTREALEHSGLLINLNVVDDGVEALDYLRREGKYSASVRPDLILLDLNLPRKNGLETLAEIKADEHLKMIPVAILTTSKAETDIYNAYGGHANCYITKPVDFDKFVSVIRTIDEFWLTVVRLPP